MAYFSWLADELTEIEERLAESDLAGFSGPLRAAINKAFVKACEADREHRRAQTAPVSSSEADQAFEWRPGGGAMGGAIHVKAKAKGGTVTAPIAEPASKKAKASERAHGPSRQPRAAAAPLR